MPVPTSIDDLSTTAGSNSPAGSETPTEGDNYIRTHAAFIATLRDKLNGTSNTGTIKNATFSGTMAGTASWSGLQTFAGGISVTAPTLTSATLNSPILSTATINGEVTFGEGWSLDTSGRLRNTSNEMPAFHSYMGNSDQTSGTAAVFGTELFDQGGVYNSTTGVFTAPVAGVYALNATLYLVAGGSSQAETVILEGSTAGTLCAIPVVLSASATEPFTLSCVTRLAASETVIVRIAGSAFSTNLRVEGTYSARNNSFSAALLY